MYLYDTDMVQIRILLYIELIVELCCQLQFISEKYMDRQDIAVIYTPKCKWCVRIWYI